MKACEQAIVSRVATTVYGNGQEHPTINITLVETTSGDALSDQLAPF